MSQTFFTLLTAIGEAKHANAIAMGTKVKYHEMAVGDGNGSDTIPNRQQVSLVNEVRRAAINQISIDPDNDAQIIIEQVIPETEGGWWLREVGVFDEDGDLIAVANVPATYKPQMQEGSGRTQVVRVVLLVSSTDSVTLKIDPSIVLATQEYVNTIFNAPSGVTAGTYGDASHYPIFTVDTRGRLTAAGQMEVSSVWDLIPTTYKGDIIFVKGIGEMWWVENEWMTGYRSKMCGLPAQTIDRYSRPFMLALDGGFFDKTLPKYKGLWAFINEQELLVPELDYMDGEFFFCEAGGNMVKTPNQDNMFWRNKGIDVDTANARLLGELQYDALQNVIGETSSFPKGYALPANSTGVFQDNVGVGVPSGIANGYAWSSVSIDMDISRVARTSSETRSINTAVTPFIHI